MNRKLSTTTVKVGQTQTIAGPGKFLRILSSTGGALVQIATDDGQTNNAVPGMEIEFSKSVTQAVLSCPGANADVQVKYYIGNFSFVQNPKTEPGQTIITTDWMTTGAGGGAIFCKGTLVLHGTTYRRKSITAVNVTGLSGDFNAAKLGAFEGGFTASGAMTGQANASPGWQPLMPATATQVFPVTQETDDLVVLSTVDNDGPIDFMVIQTWLPFVT